MGSPTFESLPAEIHGLILSHAPDIPTLLSLVEASRQLHQIYRVLERTVLENVVKSQTPHYILSTLLCVKAFDSAKARYLNETFLSHELGKYHDRIKTRSEYALSTEESKWLLYRNKLVEEFISEFAISKIHRLEKSFGNNNSKILTESGCITLDRSSYDLSAVEHYRLRRAFVHLDLVGSFFSVNSAKAIAMDDMNATDDTDDMEDTQGIETTQVIQATDYASELNIIYTEDELDDITDQNLLAFSNKLEASELENREFRCVVQHIWQTLDTYRPQKYNPSVVYDHGRLYPIRHMYFPLGYNMCNDLSGLKSMLAELFNAGSIKYGESLEGELIHVKAVLEGRTSQVPSRVTKHFMSWYRKSKKKLLESEYHKIQSIGTHRDDEIILAIDRVCTLDDTEGSNAATLWVSKLPSLQHEKRIYAELRSFGYAIWSDERFHRLVSTKR